MEDQAAAAVVLMNTNNGDLESFSLLAGCARPVHFWW